MKAFSCISLFLFLGIISCPFPSLQAQDSLMTGFDRLEWEAAYFGELATHPGIKLGANYPFGHRLKVKEKLKPYKGPYQLLKKHQWVAGGNLIFYHQPHNHNGFLVNAELGRRRIKHKSFRRTRYTLWEIDLGVGYYHYLLTGTTFRPTNGGFESSRGQGTALMPSLSFSWGRSLRSAKPKAGFIYVKINTLYEVPFGTGFQMRLGLESGVVFPFSQTKTPVSPL